MSDSYNTHIFFDLYEHQWVSSYMFNIRQQIATLQFLSVVRLAVSKSDQPSVAARLDKFVTLIIFFSSILQSSFHEV